MTGTDIHPTVTGAAVWFDGRSTERQHVQWRAEHAHLILQSVQGETLCRLPLAACRASEAWPDIPTPVALPDGSSLWLPAGVRLPVHPAAAGYRRRLGVPAVIRSAWGVAAALIGLILLLVWLDRQGVGLAAEAALQVVPARVDRAVGEQAASWVDARWLAPTKIPAERQERIRQRFLTAALQLDRFTPIRVQFSAAKDGNDFNAFALPHGAVYVLDGLAERLSDDELLAVLGHEMGHVVHRHGMKALMRQAGLVAVAGVAFGDFSSVAASTVSTLQFLSHSRDAERQADAYARRFVAAAGLPPTVLISLWQKFAAERPRDGGIPAWMSTHPSTEERLRKASEGDPP